MTKKSDSFFEQLFSALNNRQDYAQSDRMFLVSSVVNVQLINEAIFENDILLSNLENLVKQHNVFSTVLTDFSIALHECYTQGNYNGAYLLAEQISQIDKLLMCQERCTLLFVEQLLSSFSADKALNASTEQLKIYQEKMQDDVIVLQKKISPYLPKEKK